MISGTCGWFCLHDHKYLVRSPEVRSARSSPSIDPLTQLSVSTGAIVGYPDWVQKKMRARRGAVALGFWRVSAFRLAIAPCMRAAGSGKGRAVHLLEV